MQGRMNPGQIRCRTDAMQDSQTEGLMDAGQNESIQDRVDAGQDRCSTGQIQDRSNASAGKMQDRIEAGKVKGSRVRMQDR